MNNCFVTKFKASVNNPDLPVLETMQQYTLDAIAASGNSSLTDEQRWALNSLFIALGVNGSNQVMSKIRKLYLPMIAGDVSKALINYATDSFVKDVTPNSANWELRNNGIAQKSSGQNFEITLNNPLVATNYTYMWMRTENVTGKTGACCGTHVRGITDGTQHIAITETSSNGTNISFNVQGYSGFPNYVPTPAEQRCVSGISYRAANDISKQLYGDYSLITDGSITATADMSNETSETLYILGSSNQQAALPFGFILLGEALSETDFKKIRDAVNALYAAIKA